MSFKFNVRLPWRASLLLAAAVPLSLAHAEEVLTLAAAVQTAVQRSQQLAGQGAAIRASEQLAVAAAQLPDPVLKAGIDNLPVSGPDRANIGADSMTMRRIGISQEITGANKRQLRAERYTLEAQQGQAELGQARTAIGRDTTLAWLECHYAGQALALVVAQREQLAQEVQAAQAAYRGGRGSQADVLAASVALGQADDRLSAARRRVRSATQLLGRWVGETVAARTLAAPPAIDRIPLDLDHLDAELNSAPEIVLLSRREAVRASEARLAAAERKPDWTFDVAWQQRGSGYSNMISFGISVPLQWDRAQRQDRTLSARLAQVDQARAEREEQHRAHLAETRIMVEDWQSGRDRQQRYAAELVPLAQQRADAVLAAYRGGKSSLTEVLAARRDILDTRLTALQLEADTARLWAQLNYILPTEQP